MPLGKMIYLILLALVCAFFILTAFYEVFKYIRKKIRMYRSMKEMLALREILDNPDLSKFPRNYFQKELRKLKGN